MPEVTLAPEVLLVSCVVVLDVEVVGLEVELLAEGDVPEVALLVSAVEFAAAVSVCATLTDAVVWDAVSVWPASVTVGVAVTATPSNIILGSSA